MADHNNMEGGNIMAESQYFYATVPLMPLNSNPEKMEGNRYGRKYENFVTWNFFKLQINNQKTTVRIFSSAFVLVDMYFRVRLSYVWKF